MQACAPLYRRLQILPNHVHPRSCSPACCLPLPAGVYKISTGAVPRARAAPAFDSQRIPKGVSLAGYDAKALYTDHSGPVTVWGSAVYDGACAAQVHLKLACFGAAGVWVGVAPRGAAEDAVIGSTHDGGCAWHTNGWMRSQGVCFVGGGAGSVAAGLEGCLLVESSLVPRRQHAGSVWAACRRHGGRVEAHATHPLLVQPLVLLVTRGTAGTRFKPGDTMTVAIDLVAGMLHISRNGELFRSHTAGLAGPLVLGVTLGTPGDEVWLLPRPLILDLHHCMGKAEGHSLLQYCCWTAESQER